MPAIQNTSIMLLKFTIGKRLVAAALLLAILSEPLHAQPQPDTSLVKTLEEITVKSYRSGVSELRSLGDVQGTYLSAGKKHEVLLIQDLPANVAEKTGRQLFAKVPGAFVYDMDGSGNQVNISTRGLDPHRSWEYNVRQNGILTNSDLYGYPASHYSAPMEAIQRIELTRGTASLQYGSQFGGMINYVTKQADTSRVLGFESLTSAGSFGLLSSFNAIGGKKGKLTYYAYYQRRVSDGYRDNARSDAQAQFVSLGYAFSKVLHARAELGRSQYLYQVPGPLTDAMFAENPRQSTRRRNFFNPDIYLPSLTLDWQLGERTHLNWVSSAVLGSRSSLQFIGFANVPDDIDPATGTYKPRQVDIDQFNSYTSELRLRQDYGRGGQVHTLTAGIRYFNNDLHRRQQGKGTTGTDFDLSLTEPTFGRDVRFKTHTVAAFVENLFRITPRLQVSAGLRVERGSSRMSGIIAYLPNERVPQDILYSFPLLGLGGEYKLSAQHKVYGGWSQAYRPVLFSDIIPATPLDRTDPGLKNSFGHNAELGIKGRWADRLSYDLSVFQILYQNRIGSIILTDEQGEDYIWRTNTGDSRTNGVEMYVECALWDKPVSRVSAFSATSFFEGIYLRGMIREGDQNMDIANNILDGVPRWTSRNGLQWGYKRITAILQYSYVAAHFADALNTVAPTPNGGRGLVPAYSIWDLNLSCRLGAHYLLRVGVNNFTNASYFTKRPTVYPGPGVWSSDGRGVVVSFGIKL